MNRSVYVVNTAILGLPLRESFDYLSDTKLDIGQRIIVDFAGRIEVGVVLNCEKVKEEREMENLKPIVGILDERSFISQEDVKLGKIVSEYFLSPIGKVMELFFPHGSDVKIKEMVIKKSEMAPGFLPKETAIEKKKYMERLGGERKGKKILMKLLKLGIVDVTISYKLREPKISKVKVIHLKARLKDILKSVRPGKKREILEYLLINDHVSLKKLKKDLNLKNLKPLKELEMKGYIYTTYENEVIDEYMESFPKPRLTRNQSRIINDILTSKNKKHIIYGVTGSGKTEVYFRLIEKFLSYKKNVLYLLPEISLTPQLFARIKDRFKEYEVGIYHSDLKKSERFLQWIKVVENKTRIIVGTRSSLWLPMKNLGLIIVDEEQDESYYQGDMEPIYDGTKVAGWKASLFNATIVFGSATPKISTYYFGKTKEYELHEIHERAVGKLPKVKIVDLRKEERYGSIFSKKLVEAMENTLKLRGQIILFSNRKGFFPYIMCRNCGYIHRCVNCDVAMTYHFDTKSLKCHYCGREEKVPSRCPVCGSREIVSRGFGTERVEREVIRIFPGVRVMRMDRERINTISSLTKALELIREQKVDVIVGTKMVAKGLDFPGVSLVGILNIDQLLSFPDYRSSERIFEILAQVAGRSGRGRFEGTVILQTYNPEAFPIKFAVKHDYISFYEKEIMNRRELKYPPFVNIIRITVAHSQSDEAREKAWELKCILDESLSSEVLGPVQAIIFKLKGIYRYRIFIKSIDVLNDMKKIKTVMDDMNIWKMVKIEVNPPI